jgi:hypothetical protein
MKSDSLACIRNGRTLLSNTSDNFPRLAGVALQPHAAAALGSVGKWLQPAARTAVDAPQKVIVT